jgi:TMEM175 potassium channel family protein
MMSEEPRRPAPVDMGAGRLEAFSDAVMAVIITILAFELRPPHGATIAAVRDQLPSLFIYVLAFTFVAIYWNNHHHLLRATTRISGAVMWANMFLLFWLSLIPVVTEWLRGYYHEPLPAAAFGLIGLAAALAYTFLVRAIIRANGRDSLVGTAISSDLKGNLSLVLYLAGVALAFVSVWVAYALYAAVAVIWLIPDRRFARANKPSE